MNEHASFASPLPASVGSNHSQASKPRYPIAPPMNGGSSASSLTPMDDNESRWFLTSSNASSPPLTTSTGSAPMNEYLANCRPPSTDSSRNECWDLSASFR